MSGTSLDGLDLAYCTFTHSEQGWQYAIVQAETIAYSKEWKNRLATIEKGTASDFALTDVEYGRLLGQLTREFVEKYALKPDFISSHGHTIFHQPGKRFTFQIGQGAAIAAETGIPVISDFRSLDVALGGQGAPLVPIGDRLLFSRFDFCLNLGGFANTSFESSGKRIAFDICPVNIVLNHLAGRCGKAYDPNGEMAAIGTISTSLLSKLNQLPYYQATAPKSLGKEWVLAHIYPLLDGSNLPLNDLLATFCEHVAQQIGLATKTEKPTRLLVTGGGAFNEYLIQRIQHHTTHEVIIPDPMTINFKEALIFAFLGVLRWRNEVNCLSSVTGATKDSSGGAIIHHQ